MKITDIEPPGLHSFEPVALEYLLPKTAANKHFYSNGVSRLIPRLTLKVHSDLETCFALWDKFSTNETLFDLWDFRYAWMKGYGYRQYFYTLYEGKRALGTLPLMYNVEDKQYEWIGGYWMEGNKFMAEDERVIDLLLSAVPIPISLMSIEETEKNKAPYMAADFKEEEDLKYTKDVSRLSSIEAMLAACKKKDRYHIKYDHRRIMQQSPRIESLKDHAVLEELFALNIKRFDESVYKDDKQANSFRETLKNTGLYDYKFVKASVGGKTAAVDLILQYKDIYYQMTGANDVKNFSGIGNFMVYAEIEDAIRNGYRIIDCLQEDHSWKHRYFEGRRMYAFSK